MLKRLLLSAMLCFIALPTVAQESASWQAYLFDNINHDLIRVNASGETDVFSLGVDSDNGQFLSRDQIAISPDGKTVAYCGIKPNVMSSQMMLVIRDIENESNLHTVDLGIQQWCAVTAFSRDGSQLALSIVHYAAFDTVPEGASTWSLQIMDVATAETVQTLTQVDGLVPASDLFPDEVPYLARVQLLDEEIVRFFAIPWVGIGGPAHVDAFEWHMPTNTVEQLSREFGRFNNDTLVEGGELVYPYWNENMTAAMAEGPTPQANEVQILTTSSDTPTTIFSTEEWVIVDTKFVSGGQAIAVTSLRGAEGLSAPEEGNDIRIDLVYRDGAIVQVPRLFNDMVDVENIPSGVVIVHMENPSDGTFNPTNIYTFDGETLSQVASYLPNFETAWSPPQLLWVTPLVMGAPLSDFEAVG